MYCDTGKVLLFTNFDLRCDVPGADDVENSGFLGCYAQ
jgi:hypothetical protein